MGFNYEQDTAIDPEDLLEEFLRLPSTFYRYQRELAEKEKEVKGVWEDLKVTRSKLVGEAREEGGAKNATEIEAYYRQHPDHIKAKKKLIQAEYERDLTKAAVSAFYRKETGMEWVGRLIKMEYWAGPKRMQSVPSGKRIYSQALDSASDKQRDLLNKNRKPRRASSRRRKER
jgi:hypothetical protein